MFDGPQRTIASLLVVACFGLTPVVHAAVPLKLSGGISGRVADSAGVPQMGAAVILFNKQDRVYSRTLTDLHGEFTFAGLLPDVYSVRVSLAAFVPAFKKDILVQPGMRSLLAINLNTLFSSIQLGYPIVDSGALMSDEWKWVLRGSTETRPVLRLVETVKRKKPQGQGQAFSETQGLVQVSAGDAPTNGTATAADVGTAFALATSVYGNNRLEVSGNLGSPTGVPMTAFRTGYRRRGAFGPEASVTVRQLSFGGGLNRSGEMLRSVTASFDNETEVMDGLTMKYGISADSVQFLERNTFLSPYARLNYKLSDGSEISATYTSGNARPDLGVSGAQDEEQLQRSVRTLGWFPRMSMRSGRPAIQRGDNLELAYRRKAGSRQYEVSAFTETVRNAALTMAAPAGFFSESDVLPDSFSGNSTFNAGNYTGAGYTMAVTQNLGDCISGSLMYGSTSALTVRDRELISENPDELRAMLRTGRKRSATARVTIAAPLSGTRMIVSYQWSDHRWVMPGHLYATQAMRPEPGLNVSFRQPVPGISGRPWRVEVVADLRNLTALGYLPITTATGQTVLLVETPRSVRGGLNLIF
jgi:hypothetical protein